MSNIYKNNALTLGPSDPGKSSSLMSKDRPLYGESSSSWPRDSLPGTCNEPPHGNAPTGIKKVYLTESLIRARGLDNNRLLHASHQYSDSRIRPHMAEAVAARGAEQKHDKLADM
jgi:hypothetical protein